MTGLIRRDRTCDMGDNQLEGTVEEQYEQEDGASVSELQSENDEETDAADKGGEQEGET